MDTLDFSKYQPVKEPLTEEEEFKNLYYKYEYEKIDTLQDVRAKENGKTVIELSLDENISHTSNLC